jgi:sulfite exporter TauE/SafE
MSTSIAVTALLMGLAGGPHCAAMCGAACAGITRLGAQSGTQARWRSMGAFQAGRLTGYAVAGATAAFAVGNLAALTEHMAALRPLWTLFHLAVLTWGLMMLAQAHQPQWVSAAGRATWSRIRPLAGARGGVFMTGALWAFMPCGLLYSALLVASLSAGPLEGAIAMALFALGGSAALTLAPWLFKRLREGWGTRAAGALLVLVAAGSLWVDTAHRVAQWCQSL